MLQVRTLITLILLAYAASLEAQLHLPQPVSSHHTAIREGFYIYSDAGRHFSVDSMFTLYTAGKFKNNITNVINTSYSHARIWVGITLYNADSFPAVLRYEIAEPSLDELELFKVNENKMVSLGKTGDLLPFYHRPIDNKNFVYPVTLAPGDTVHLLLYINNNGHTTYTRLNIKDEVSFNRSSATEYLVWGLFTGVGLFVSIFAFFIFISLKDRLYLFYSLYILLGMIWGCSNNGTGYQYLWSDYPEIMGKIRFISGTAAIAIMLRFMQLFLNQQKNNSRLFWLTTVVKYVLLLLVVLAFVPMEYTRRPVMLTTFLVIGDIISLAALACLLVSPIEKIRQGLRAAVYYLFAVGFFFISMSFTFLIRLGILEANVYTMNAVYIGFLTEIIVLTFGLTMRYNQYKNDRERLLVQIKEKEIAEAVKIALAREGERKRIAADMHDDLGAGLSGLQLRSELNSRKTDAEELQKDMAKLSSSARELGNKVRDIVWTLNAENDSLENLILYTHKYGHQLFEETAVSFHMKMPESIPAMQVNGTIRKHLFLLVKEALNNILKHAGASEATCLFTIGTDLSIRISDNGRGFQPGSFATGNGIVNMQRRVQQLDGRMDIQAGSGTVVSFVIPLERLSTPNGE
jgi:signal transduction histidine kinase